MIYFRYPLAVLLMIPVLLFVLYAARPKGRGAVLLTASKLSVVFIIVLAAASPYIEENVMGLTEPADVSIIADHTESMRIFGSYDEAVDRIVNGTPATIDYISGTRSAVGDAVIRNVKQGGDILLISDGNSNSGKSLTEAISFARTMNATVDLLRFEPEKKDISISIEGASVVVADSPVTFYLDVRTVGGIGGRLAAWIDGVEVFNESADRSERIPLTHSFREAGSHTLRAGFTGVKDEFPQNDVFYRSVHVVPQPHVLLVSDSESPLSRIMGELYAVDRAQDPAAAARYKAVVLDDLSAAGLSFSDSLVLSEYVANGGGLVVAGGENAFTDYDRLPLLEQLIPVKQGGAPPTAAKTAVVILVDISGSTGDLSGSDLKLGVEKGLALQVIEYPGRNDYIGVIAFNNAPHSVVPLAQYADRSGVRDAIEKLRFGGTTRLSPALLAARDMLRDFGGGRNVIVISDGAVADGEAALKAARAMSGDGITVYSIGVGGDTDTDFMTRLSEAGGGGYLRRDAANGIKVLFREKETGTGQGYPLRIINSGHFITQDAAVNATVLGYNNVRPKQNAQTLVITDNGNPVITAWRVGLGRVVAITVDNGNYWAPALYGAGNSDLVTRSINYAVGTPDGTGLRAMDGEMGEPVEITAVSDGEPELSFDGAPLQFRRTGERQFSAVIYPASTGFHDISGYAIAVNEPEEYRYIGNNELMPAIISASGGKIYNESEAGGIIRDIRVKKTGMIRQVTDLRPAFLLAALLLYAAGVIFGRIAGLIGKARA